jgi:sulfatase maturation enzyme AslB (radical SAM superfamily)
MSIRERVFEFFEARLPSPVWGRVTRVAESRRERQIYRRRASPTDPDLADKFCSRPFEFFEINEAGSVNLCCPSWLPRPAGNLNAQDAWTIWNSARAQEIRRSVLDGDFKHCSRDLCPLIVSDTLPTRAQALQNPAWREIIDQRKTVLESGPKTINLSNDRSCNLSCPSCRTRRTNYTRGRAYTLRKRLQERLVAAFFSEPSHDVFTVNVTGSGDPFASRVFREFLYDLDSSKFPNLNVSLQTNGTLFNEKTWNKLHKIHGHIGAVIVSFDAAREETYRITRRGGDWRHLVQNVRFLSDLRASGKIGYLRLDYVVQFANFREMPEFVAFAQTLCVDEINFSKAANWGAWSAADFRRVSVWEPGHPDHGEFQRIVSSPILTDPRVFLGNLTGDRRRAVEMHRELAVAP